MAVSVPKKRLVITPCSDILASPFYTSGIPVWGFRASFCVFHERQQRGA